MILLTDLESEGKKGQKGHCPCSRGTWLMALVVGMKDAFLGMCLKGGGQMGLTFQVRYTREYNDDVNLVVC